MKQNSDATQDKLKGIARDIDVISEQLKDHDKRLIYLEKKGINNYSGTILILGLFLLDSLLGSVTIFMGQAETVEEWAEQINLFVGLRSIMNIAPYTIILDPDEHEGLYFS